MCIAGLLDHAGHLRCVHAFVSLAGCPSGQCTGHAGGRQTPASHGCCRKIDRFGGDLERVWLVGQSAGGQLAMLALLNQATQVR